MKVLILAGGEGCRLLPLTKFHSKVMSSVHGKPFISYMLELYKKQDIVLSVGDMSEGIKAWCKENNVWPEFAEECEQLDTSGAILNAKSFLLPCRYFAVVNGDTYHNVDLTDAKKSFLSDDVMARRIKAKNKLTDVIEDCGVYFFKKDAFRFFRKGFSIESILKCVPHSVIVYENKFFLDIGTHNGLSYAKKSKLLL